MAATNFHKLINETENWSNMQGIKLNPAEKKCLFFIKNPQLQSNNINLTLYNHKIKSSKETTFLWDDIIKQHDLDKTHQEPGTKCKQPSCSSQSSLCKDSWISLCSKVNKIYLLFIQPPAVPENHWNWHTDSYTTSAITTTITYTS